MPIIRTKTAMLVLLCLNVFSLSGQEKFYRLIVFYCLIAFFPAKIYGQASDNQLAILEPLIGEWTSALFQLEVETQYTFLLNDKIVKRSNQVSAIKQSDETQIYWDPIAEEIKFFTLTNAGWISFGKVFHEGELIVFEGTSIKDDDIFKTKNTLEPLSKDIIQDHHYSWDNGWLLQHTSILERIT